MPRRVLGYVLVLICAVCNCFAEDLANVIGKLESRDARDAILAYENTVSASHEEFSKRLTMARKKLVAELETAQKKATQANQLDEAVRIRDVKRAYKTDKIPSPPMTEIHIVAAFYGQNISWLDVTEKVRRAVNGKAEWSSKVVTEDWGEPAPGFGGPRTLIIRYMEDGKVNFRAAYQGMEISIP